MVMSPFTSTLLAAALFGTVQGFVVTRCGHCHPEAIAYAFVRRCACSAPTAHS